MKNKDMPAMPQSFAMTEQECGTTVSHMPNDELPMNIGLTKREMFAMNAPEMPREFYVDFFNKYNSCDVSWYIAHDEPCLSVKGILAANKEWRYAYADLMLEE